LLKCSSASDSTQAESYKVASSSEEEDALSPIRKPRKLTDENGDNELDDSNKKLLVTPKATQQTNNGRASTNFSIKKQAKHAQKRKRNVYSGNKG